MTNDGATLTINSDASLYINGNFTNQNSGTIANAGILRLTEDLTNNATFSSSGDGVIIFEGTNQQEIFGTTAVNTQDLTLNNSNGLRLNQNINVFDDLTLSNGDLDLNNQVIDLSTTGSLINEVSGRQIIDTDASDGGYIQAQADLNSPSSINVANLGVFITSSANLGTTIIRRGHDKQDNVENVNIGIERYYDIIPTNNSSLDMTVRMTYFDNELDGKNETFLEMWKSEAPYDIWEDLGADSKDNTLNFAEKTNIPDASRFTLSDAANPLPITLLEFDAKNQQNDVLLTWITLSEIDNEKFVIERSSDAINFETIGTVDGQGTAQGPFDYDYTDISPFQGESILYYRLKQVDFDGKFSYSPIRAVESSISNLTINIFPNPFIENLNIDLTSSQVEQTKLFLISNQGQIILQRNINLNEGLNQFQLNNMDRLPQGIYFVKAIINQKTIVKKLIKQ